MLKLENILELYKNYLIFILIKRFYFINKSLVFKISKNLNNIFFAINKVYNFSLFKNELRYVLKTKNLFFKINIHFNGRKIFKRVLCFTRLLKYKKKKLYKIRWKFYRFINKKILFNLFKKLLFYLKLKKIQLFYICISFKKTKKLKNSSKNVKKHRKYYFNKFLIRWRNFLFFKKISKNFTVKTNFKYLFNKSHSNNNDKLKKKRRK